MHATFATLPTKKHAANIKQTWNDSLYPENRVVTDKANLKVEVQVEQTPPPYATFATLPTKRPIANKNQTWNGCF